MNINEQMNQLGQIGNLGYTPTEAVVDQLVARTKKTRAIRQGTAAAIGSLGAVSLGLLGAQVFVSITQDNDAAKIPDRSFEFNNMDWETRYGDDYTGMGKTQDQLAKAWDDLQAAAAAKTEEPAPAAAAAKTEEPAPTKPKPPASEIPDGSFLFGNGHVYKCEQWTDSATGTTFWGAWSGTEWGWDRKMIQCDPNDKYWYTYKYMGSSATISGHTCTGSTVSYLGASHQISCRRNDVLWSKYPEWSGANGGNTKWTLNNEAGKILTNTNYKWFVSGVCGSTLYSNATPFLNLRSCHEATCDGWYYTTDQHPTRDGHRYSWNGSTWVIDDPAPEPTDPPDPEPTDPPDPEPTDPPDPEPSP